MRDDGIGFDITDHANLYFTEEPYKNIGVKIVSKIARNMIYRNTLGINYVIIDL